MWQTEMCQKHGPDWGKGSIYQVSTWSYSIGFILCNRILHWKNQSFKDVWRTHTDEQRVTVFISFRIAIVQSKVQSSCHHTFFQLSPKKIKYSKDTIKWAICEMNCLDGIVYDTISINILCRLEWHWKFKLNSSSCSCTNHFTLSTSNVKKKEKRNFAMWFKRDDVLNVTTINANRII